MKKTQEKGITLIALIITIIIMLILVGVTVSVALNGGLFDTAKKAAQGTDKAMIEEEMQGAILAAVDNNGNIDLDKLRQELLKIKAIESVGENFPLSVKDKNGNEWIIDADGVIKTKEPEVEKIITPEDEEYAYWKTDGNGKIMCYNPPDESTISKLVVPSKIVHGDESEENITAIGEYALSASKITYNESGEIEFESDSHGDPVDAPYMKMVKEIIIPAGVSKIENFAFEDLLNCETILLPDTVTNIGESAFWYSESLKEINLPSELTEILPSTFQGCSGLQRINLPTKLTLIGEWAFEDCTSLTSINIPNSLTTIGRETFGNCTSIEKIYIPESVDNMGYAAFRGWTNEQAIKMGKSEEPVRIHESYTKIGWEYNWDSACNANIEWGAVR